MISWVAMDRIVERQRAADAAYRKQAAGKVLRSDAKLLTDGDLLAKLRSFGIELDRRRNARNAPLISTNAGRVKVRVIRTDEELMIAMSVTRVLKLGSIRET